MDVMRLRLHALSSIVRQCVRTLVVLGVVAGVLYVVGVAIMSLVPELNFSLGPRGILSRWCLSLYCVFR
ncbi:hypothetical protein DBV14_14685 [Variovorax sp. KBW07]|nr:hypothetical protein DBV14_14685 [Variovorax sp. KBW07]